VDSYLSQVWNTACTKDPWPAAFPALVADMLDFATTASTWRGRSGTGALALAVAGLSERGHSPVTEQQTAAIRAAVPTWSTWFGEHMGHDDFAYAAVRFFGEPAAAAFVHDAVGWLAARERSSDRPSERVDTAVTEFLVTISTRTPNLLRGTGPIAENGRQILARLHGRGKRRGRPAPQQHDLTASHHRPAALAFFNAFFATAHRPISISRRTRCLGRPPTRVGLRYRSHSDTLTPPGSLPVRADRVGVVAFGHRSARSCPDRS
jgi:hypothetical protein